MNLLFGTCYDPTSAVLAFTTSTTGVAIVAFDTVNLRATFTVPPSGYVRVRMSAQVHGATTFPTILLAVMSGAGIVKRQNPMQSLGNTAVATAQVKVESDFIVSGLTAGEARTWDAGYGVEVGVGSSAVKYGGPNDAVANNAFGGFAFEVWDPCPFYTPGASGVPPTTPQIAYTSGIKAKTDLIPAAPASTTNITAGTITTVGSVSGLTAANLDAAISSRMATYTQPTGFLSATFPAGTVASTTNITAGTMTTTTNLTNAPTSGDFTSTMKTSIGTAVAASAVASVTGNVGGNVTGSVGSVVGLTASNLDATVSSRLASASYTAPDNTNIGVAAAQATAAATDTAAIKLKTDSLNFSVAGKVDGNIKAVNDTTVTGAGTSGSPWGP